MAKYRKKPVKVEAMQFKGRDLILMDGTSFFVYYDEKGPCLKIKTLEGIMRADYNDWIVTGPFGEHYPVKPVIFDATYEKVEE